MPKGSIRNPGTEKTSRSRGARDMFNKQTLAAKDLNRRYKDAVKRAAAKKK